MAAVSAVVGGVMRRWVFSVILLVVAVAGGLFVWQRLSPIVGFEEEVVWRGWQGRARGDKYFLVRELLARHQGRLSVVSEVREDWDLAGVDVVVLAHGVGEIDDEYDAVLKSWVAGGGHVIMTDEESLMRHLGVTEEPVLDGVKSSEPSNVIVWGEVVLNESFGGACVSKRFAGHALQRVAVERGTDCEFAWQWSYGQGRVTVLNWRLLRLWESEPPYVHVGDRVSVKDIPILTKGAPAFILDLVGRGSEVQLVERFAPPQWRWWELVARWWAVVLCVLCLVVCVLWRYMPRFGALIPDEQQGRGVDWLAHFSAAGRLMDEHAARGRLVAMARARLLRAQQVDEAVLLSWAECADLPLARVRQAMLGQVESDQVFIRVMADLERLRVALRC